MQRNVSPSIARDFGTRIAPTKSGLEYLSSLPKDQLNNIITGQRFGKQDKSAKAGSFKSFTAQERTAIEDSIRSANERGDLPTDYAEQNFQDDEWFFRYPSVRRVVFDNQEDYNNYLQEQNDNLIDNRYVVSDKQDFTLNLFMYQKELLKLKNKKLLEP